MLEFLLQRSTVIALAILGGALSLAVSWFSGRGSMSPATLNLLNKAAYGCMAASMILFIFAGLLAGREE